MNALLSGTPLLLYANARPSPLWLERHAAALATGAVEFAGLVSLMAICVGLMAEFS